MTKKNKKLLGVLTFLPFVLLLVYMFFFFLSFFGMFLAAGHNHEPNMGLFMGSFGIAFAIIGLMSVLSIGLLIYYIIHITNNKKFDDTNRLIWILIIVFANIIGYGIYWYLNIWKVDEEIPVK
jgi:hypothetical protein